MLDLWVREAHLHPPQGWQTQVSELIIIREVFGGEWKVGHGNGAVITNDLHTAVRWGLHLATTEGKALEIVNLP